MNELVFIEKGKTITDSLTIAKMFGKRHNNVVRDIKRILERETEYINDFLLSSYISDQNKEYACFQVTAKGKERLFNRYKHKAHSASLEKTLGEWLEKLFPNERIIKQYKASKYKIDFYMIDLGICIEYDEIEHKYRSEKDEMRQREIQEWLKEYHLENIEYDPVLLKKDASEAFPFVRIKEGEEIEGLRELFITMRNHTMNDIVLYME